MSILVVPSELLEVLAISGRMVVLKEGPITRAFSRGCTLGRVMLVATG
jgi:ABC-type sugar transport system ATPase subunit